MRPNFERYKLHVINIFYYCYRNEITIKKIAPNRRVLRPAFYNTFQKLGEKIKKVRNFCIKTRKHFLTVTDPC